MPKTLPDYVSAPEAAAVLKVSLPTLYAYVSRGLIRSEAVGGSRRARRYRRDDLERLQERQAQRRNPGRAVQQAAARALQWGAPVLESGLTLIEDGRLYYRGQEAVHLAETHTFESVAALLWDTDAAALAAARPPNLRPWAAALAARADPSPAAALQVVLPLAAQSDLSAYDLRPAAVRQTGARLLQTLAAAAAYPAQLAAGPLAEALAQAWAPRLPAAPRLLTAALILCADHELNVSAFTARCVASAGATPYDVVIAGLAALRGARHGGHTARVEALLDEIGAPGRAGRVLAARLQRGEALPGFGHRLYPPPGGDPRGRHLLALAQERLPRARAVALNRAVCAEADRLLGERPTLDFALVVLARALRLPPGAPLALFALGRTAGWVAQALEQYALGDMIRPRARYVGVAPAGAA
ncbi:MAG: citrate synthase family protein [Anaerolineales bacterium]|nr:citrate synthase family protein [Anaerolineales bacterium]